MVPIGSRESPTPGDRAVLRVTLACDGRCIFCAQGSLKGVPDSLPEITERIHRLRSSGFDEITFAGGEPTLWPALVEAVRSARSTGFVRAGLQTNGQSLASGHLLDALVSAGLTDVHLSLHGGDARVHDYHAGAAGSFSNTRSTMSRARAAGLEVGVTTVLTKSNFRVVGALPGLLASSGASAWHVASAVDAGRAAAAFHNVLPRLALAVPFALHAIEAAGTLGLPSFISGIPLCLLGPFAARACAEPGRSFAGACSTCAGRASCAGLDARYLARHGGDELSPRPPVAASGDRRREEALRRLFVGIGEREAPLSAPVPAPPKSARRSAIAGAA